MTSVYHFATNSCATDVLQPEHLSWTYSILLMLLDVCVQLVKTSLGFLVENSILFRIERLSPLILKMLTKSFG